MDKICFLMTRKNGLTRQEFFDHYLQVHSLLGLRHCVLMAGYSVNLTDGEDPRFPGPDSITEAWTPDALGFMDPARAFRNEYEMNEVMADDRSFIGANLGYVVEEELVLGGWPTGEVRTRTPGVKRISLYTGDVIPAVGGGVERMVVDRVTNTLLPESSPKIDFFLSEWAPSLEALPPIDRPAFIVSEFCQRHPKR